MDDRRLLDLCIVRLPGLSGRERVLLLEFFEREGGAEQDGAGVSLLIQQSKKDIEQIIGREHGRFWNAGRILARAERDAVTARTRGIRWVSWNRRAYPPLLREMYDPPGVLFFRGNLPDPEKPLAAVVGTRRPGPQAAAQAYDISRDLGRRGISVVSGLALGIDSMAHRGNLEGGAPTFAVLGSGVDEIYPSSNRHLAQRILETGGALLSEYPPGEGPRKWTFPARNRIISGLARGVLIVEAPRHSGALITARRALEQGRDLWVASAGAASAGAAELAGDGAGLVSSAADILKEWNWETGIPEADVLTGAGTGPESGRALALELAKRLQIGL